MDKGISERTESEEKDTIKIATIAAVAKAIKDNAGNRQFRYNGEEDNNKHLQILVWNTIFITKTYSSYIHYILHLLHLTFVTSCIH